METNVTEIVPPSAAVQNYLQEQDLAKIAAQISVPTDDNDIQTALEVFGEPQVLVKEDKADRRTRLKTVMAVRAQNGKSIEWKPQEAEEEVPVDYWMEGPEELTSARQFIKEYSAQTCAYRLGRARMAWDLCNGTKRGKTLEKEVARRKALHAELAKLQLFGTQSGFARSVSCVRFSGDGHHFGTADWSGTIKVLDKKNLETFYSEQIHSGKATLAWAGFGWISGGEDGEIVVSNFELDWKGTLSGHEARVACIDMHPSLKYALSASYDKTWRLWDMTTQQCLLVQKGHSREVSTVKAHPDGALVVSAGLDGLGRVWDLRSGASIMVLNGHAREIYCCDISPNGYEVATGSADNTVGIWDLRASAQSAWIPAHSSVVTDLHYKNGGDVLVTCGYDQRVRLWSADDWVLRQTLESTSRLMSVDFLDDLTADIVGDVLVAGRWDRCVDLFKASKTPN